MLRSLDLGRWFLRTRNGTSSDIARVTRITHAADGIVEIQDPTSGNYGQVSLLEYMFEVQG